MSKEKNIKDDFRKNHYRKTLIKAAIILVIAVGVVGICIVSIHKGLTINIQNNFVPENSIQKYIPDKNEERLLDAVSKQNIPAIYKYSCEKATKAIVEFQKLHSDGKWKVVAENELDLSGLKSAYLSVTEQDDIIAISTETASVESSESDSIKKNVKHIEFQSKTASTCVYLQREKIELGKDIILQLWTDESLYCVNNKVSLQQTFKKLQSNPNGNSSCIIIRFE